VLVAGGIGGANAFALTSAEAYRPMRASRITQGSLNTGRNSWTATFLPISGQVRVAAGLEGA